MAIGRPVVDITGQTFGALTVERLARTHPRQGAVWLCRCRCGKYVAVLRSNLVKVGNGQKSCGKKCPYSRYRRSGVSDEVKRLAAAGMKQADIARRLQVTPQNVSSILQRAIH